MREKISNAPKVRKPSCKHGWTMPVYQDSFRSYISFLRYRAETKKESNFFSIFRSCDLDLCPTNLNINRFPPLTIRHVCAKFYLDPTFRSEDIIRKRKK